MGHPPRVTVVPDVRLAWLAPAVERIGLTHDAAERPAGVVKNR